MGNLVVKAKQRLRQSELPPGNIVNQLEVSSLRTDRKTNSDSLANRALSRPIDLPGLSAHTQNSKCVQCGGSRAAQSAKTEQVRRKPQLVVRADSHQPETTATTSVRHCTFASCKFSENSKDGTGFTKHVQSHTTHDHLHCPLCGAVKQSLSDFIEHNRTRHGGRGITAPALQFCYRKQNRTSWVRRCEICGLYGIETSAHKAHLLAHQLQLTKEYRAALSEQTYLVQDIIRREYTLERVRLALDEIKTPPACIHSRENNGISKSSSCSHGKVRRDEPVEVKVSDGDKPVSSADRRQSAGSLPPAASRHIYRASRLYRRGRERASI